MIGTALPHAVRHAANHGPRRGDGRIAYLILHYTGMASSAAAVDWLCAQRSGVSCHYLVDEKGGIVQMVDERLRAWHAGESFWKGETDINSHSIGIEIHNRGHTLGYGRFPARQVHAVIELCQDLTARYGIAPQNVLAHSDVAPGRKVDPGEKFPWSVLARHGVGHWVRPTPIRPAPGTPVDGGELTELLEAYGYGVGVRGPERPSLRTVVEAFQRHFRPVRVDGEADRSTVETLRRLLTTLPRDA